jgi:hypothetical protein
VTARIEIHFFQSDWSGVQELGWTQVMWWRNFGSGWGSGFSVQEGSAKQRPMLCACAVLESLGDWLPQSKEESLVIAKSIDKHFQTFTEPTTCFKAWSLRLRNVSKSKKLRSSRSQAQQQIMQRVFCWGFGNAITTVLPVIWEAPPFDGIITATLSPVRSRKLETFKKFTEQTDPVPRTAPRSPVRVGPRIYFYCGNTRKWERVWHEFAGTGMIIIIWLDLWVYR